MYIFFMHVTIPNAAMGIPVVMQRACTCYTAEITNHCCTAKITLCSLLEDCRTPVSQHHALARVGH